MVNKRLETAKAWVTPERLAAVNAARKGNGKEPLSYDEAVSHVQFMSDLERQSLAAKLSNDASLASA